MSANLYFVKFLAEPSISSFNNISTGSSIPFFGKRTVLLAEDNASDRRTLLYSISPWHFSDAYNYGWRKICSVILKENISMVDDYP
jgi:hypothetical protein